jgi:pumilio homology domain family member 6
MTFPNHDIGQSSKETHAEQKRLARERKAAKPLADELHRTKKIWERLRRKSHVPKEERQKLVDELFEIITGRIKDFVLKHDSVRAVQTALKYSTPERRKQIARELKGTYVQLAESRYAKFLVGKLLVNNDDEIRDLIIPEFYGKVRKLINHPEASWILDDIYRTVATKSQKAILLREWYGPEFSLFDQTKITDPSSDLSKVLEDDPHKRGVIMKSLVEMINSLIQKKMTGFTMLHDAMLQYFRNLKPETEEFSEFFELIKGDEAGDLLKNMAFTRSGARLSCLLLAYGSSKDRRQLLKTYKDTIVLMAGDPYGHMVLLTAYDVIDDTKMSSKAIFPELIGEGDDEKITENIVAASSNPNARITILYLLEGQTKSLFPASHSEDLEILNEIHEIRKATSKKESDVRRMELVTAMSASLIKAVASSPGVFLSDPFGCQFVSEVLLSAAGDKKGALEAVAAHAAGDPNADVAANGNDAAVKLHHISRTPAGGRLFKTLIAGGKFDKNTGQIKQVDPPLKFADILYPVIKDYVVDWATGPSSFVVLNMLEAADFSESSELKQKLKKNKKALEKAATEETAEQKADRELREQSQAETKQGKKAKKGAAKQDRPVGNMGSRLLLEKVK